MGREVVRLVDARQESGRHQLRFDAAGLSSGAYFYRLTCGQRVQTQTMLVLK